MKRDRRGVASAIALVILAGCSSARAHATSTPAPQFTIAPAGGAQPATPADSSSASSSTRKASEAAALAITSALAKALGGTMVDPANTPDIPIFDAYPDDHLSDSDAAILYTTKDVLAGLVHDMKGKALYVSAYVGQTHEIRLKPGSYEFTMLITYQKCHGCQKMLEWQFDLKAGQVYILDKNEAQYFWWTLDKRDLKGQEIGLEMF